MEDSPEWTLAQKIWPKRLIPKIGFFSWATAQYRILTQDNLQRRGFALANKCVLCYDNEESMDHLLLHCNYSREVFSSTLLQFQVEWVAPRIVEDLMLQWENPFTSPWLRRLWNFGLQHVWWGLWKERNNRIFQNLSTLAPRLGIKILNFIRENVSIVKFKEL